MFNRSTLQEPTWYPEGSHRLAPPSVARDWLVDAGSLTRRVQAACDGEFRVEVRRQTRSRPLPSETARLKMRNHVVALVREVSLRCGEQPWVFARTLIPLSSLRGSARRLTMLGNRPLGALLFADPSAERGSMEFARLLPGHHQFELAAAGLEQRPAELWGRRTLFHFDGKPLLVNEIFLPDLLMR